MTARRYRIVIEGVEHQVEVDDLDEVPLRVTVDGVTYEVDLSRQSARRTATDTAGDSPEQHGVGASQQAGAAENVMTAVMPGRVVSVAVSPGDAVEQGDPVCVIEAMKMEQRMGAPRSGVIQSVFISPGDSVNYGQPLVEFE
ncbi:MAG: biotin/lipoyl-containing protein [Chloroflexota bacterium]